MKVTDIKQQQRLVGRYSIFVDGKYTFSLSEQALLEAKLNIGKELDSSQVEQLKISSGFDKLYNQLLRYIAIRQRSRWEIGNYLKLKKVEPEDQERLVSILIEKGWINDKVFAELWVSNRRQLKATNKRRLRQELLVKRVDSEIIDQVLAEDDTDEELVIKQLVDNKRRQTRYKDDDKLMQYLSRQGFGYELIKKAVKG